MVKGDQCDCGAKERCPRHGRNYARYYDTPDGCDVPTKVMVTARYGVLAGLVISTYDVLMYSHPVGLGPLISRYLVHTLPLAAMGATFAAVANGVQIARNKDDGLNYFLGGVACGPLLAYWLGSKHAVVPGAIFLGAIAFIKKTGVDEGWTFIPHIQPHRGLVWSWRNDWTLARDPKLDEPRKPPTVVCTVEDA
ncbi:NADH dehydrogenase [Phthorimaea operculella]|nr:NADH dehydrogenase [Phthorimaea operculella]